ncbi:MAG TPA: TSUP family transporter [Candidatus Acidoferrales bacterium]|nr:TSUP family transporter [Candidatus Acidoferrales bacterium]
MVIVGILLLGLLAGVASGLVGIGGGIIIVPALIYLFGLTQKVAQGTTLALLLPPVGLLAVLAYYKQGYVDIKIALFLAIGFLVGGWLGAKFATNLSSLWLERIFGFSVLLIAIKMLFFK